MNGKDVFWMLTGGALCIIAMAACAYVARTTPTTEDCIKAGGIQLMLPNHSTSCVSEETYRKISEAK